MDSVGKYYGQVRVLWELWAGSNFGGGVAVAGPQTVESKAIVSGIN